jgi:F-type H+-transporting ATPase subunit gamma
MNSPRDLRRRIRSISGTAQITKAMQMVAASKMRKAQQAALEARPFAQLLYRLQRTAVTSLQGVEHPLLEARPVHKRAVILIAADKGLCGALNSNVCRLAAQFDQDTTTYITAGRRGAQFIARSRRQLAAEFAYGDNPTFGEARAIATLARDMFVKREVDEVQVVATRFVNTLTQEPMALGVLPIGELATLKIPGVEPGQSPGGQDPIIFEPSPEAVLGFLLERYLVIFIYLLLLNAKASEQSARMVSMKNATDSAQDLIKDLTLEYNKLRQGNITRELLEIAGGQSE